MSLMRRVGILWGVLTLFTPAEGLAQMVRDSVVICHLVDDEMMVQLSAELKALGYIPILLKRRSIRLTVAEIEAIIESSGSVALMSTSPDKNRVTVWVVDPAAEKVVLVETVGGNEGEQTMASVALKSVEILRASLMRIGSKTGAARDEEEKGQPVLPPPRPEPLREAPSRLYLALGPATTWGFSELPPAFQIFTGAQIWAVGRLEIDLMGLVPTFSQKVKNEYGRARLWHSNLAAGLRIDLLPPGRRVFPWLGLVGGMQMIWIRGDAHPDIEQATPPLRDRKAFIVGGLIYLRTGLDIRLVERVSLQMGFRTGWVQPKTFVQIGQKSDRIPWGQFHLLIGGTLALRIALI